MSDAAVPGLVRLWLRLEGRRGNNGRMPRRNAGKQWRTDGWRRNQPQGSVARTGDNGYVHAASGSGGTTSTGALETHNTR
jgi:hypothetical protein